MKKILFALVFALASNFALSAQDSAPEEVTIACRAKYPKIKKVEWVKTGDSQWQAEFEMSEKEVQVVFDESGTWLGTNTELDLDNGDTEMRTMFYADGRIVTQGEDMEEVEEMMEDEESDE